ncbi:aminoglycoside 6-adenylyltransferase [Sphingobacterium daejeonense]|uniref:aminoglycoside 6-adenylyltransferase n=1 Tax=Sphingobacterium daejeonense TaxID=371142 RepID=UPI0010C5A16C|nr:aminoglycoside 6-adenylyltransferase [Sphingobacterium daejeonense]VTQ02823.1 Aminoglycoside 6-adenylyltransferase [Sphingobacterium daejeonense]
MEIRNQKLQAIKNWIHDNEDIRAALITSSLVNPLAPVDDFSDLDIELVFQETEYYLENKEWINQFGKVLNYYEESSEAFQGKHAMKMVQYIDGVKVDFKIYSVNQFKSEAANEKLPEDWDIGYSIIADKDQITKHLQPPTHQISIIKKPSFEEFQEVVKDFWWDVTYLPKCLARKDLFYLKFMIEKIIRVEYLIPMIEWYIASNNNWQITTNKYGRLFQKYLTTDEWKKLEETFAGSKIEENWIACEKILDVFDEMAKEVANRLGFKYDKEKAMAIKEFFYSYYKL